MNLDLSYNRYMDTNCIFCGIVAGTVPNYKVWEDEKHLAFLTIFPNTEGVTVVIPKIHYDSYAFELPDEVLIDLVKATKQVALLLDTKLDDVGRTAMVFEGFGVNHVHSKLFPMHGTKNKEWRPHNSNIETFSEMYEGRISTHDGELADSEYLKKVQEKITRN
jgi:histidine triad (HIT) family protein